MNVSGDPGDVKLGNNGVGDNARNQNNRRITVKDVEDSDNIVIDCTDKILTDVLAYPFGSSLLQSNSPLGVTAVYFV